MLATGTLRVCWPLGLALVPAGLPGLALVFCLQLALVTCIGVFLPAFATYRLQQTDSAMVARVLSAWSVTSSATIAALTAVWGLLAAAAGPRAAIAIAGLLLLATPILLPWHRVRSGGDGEQSFKPSVATPRAGTGGPGRGAADGWAGPG